MQTNQVTEITRDEVVSIAQKMRAEKRLLVMIHGYIEKDGIPVIAYEYGDGSNILSYVVRGETVLPTISHIYDVAASWPEREINELIAVTFEGLDCSERLFLPDNLLDGKGHILVTPMDELRKNNNLI